MKPEDFWSIYYFSQMKEEDKKEVKINKRDVQRFRKLREQNKAKMYGRS